MSYIYLVSAPVYAQRGIFKIGKTTEPSGRLYQFLTGCPPGLTPSCDLQYYGIWLVKKEEDLGWCETVVHNRFHTMRMEHDRRSEWFAFKSDEETVVKGMIRYMAEQSWVQEKGDHIYWNTRPTQSRYLRQYYHTNHTCIRKGDVRSKKMNEHQSPIIQKERDFLMDTLQLSGCVISPCGSGKTHMTSMSMKDIIRRVIIACPGQQITEQWRQTLIRDGTFTDNDIYLVQSGSTDQGLIQKFIESHEQVCMIVTYASSHLMIPFLSSFQLLVLDEAHHMAGVVRTENSDQGRTRQLLHVAVEIGIKRLSLTYTPRYVSVRDDEKDQTVLSMDDDEVFGPEIARLKFRDLVRGGILPDYRLWLLRDKERKGQGIKAKAECIMEAWKATEEVGGHTRFVCNKLIIYCPNWEEATKVEEVIRLYAMDTDVFTVKGGDTISNTLQAFEGAKRSILINCFVLGEGVDVPCADSVAILYSKKARGQITQMVLRAGRWYQYPDGRIKTVFHILLPAIDDEDIGGFEEVLCSLASNDDMIRDEVVIQLHGSSITSMKHDPFSGAEEDPQCVMIEEADAKEEEIRRCFGSARERIVGGSVRNKKERYTVVQYWNKKLGLHNKHEYNTSVQDHPVWINDPQNYFREEWQSWYHFLDIDLSQFPDTKEQWINCCIQRGLLTWDDYKENHSYDLPEDPGQLYDSYTNWDKEFGSVKDDEHIW